MARWGSWWPSESVRDPVAYGGHWEFDDSLTTADEDELRGLAMDPGEPRTHQCRSGLVAYWRPAGFPMPDAAIDPARSAAVTRVEFVQQDGRVICFEIPPEWTFGVTVNAPARLTPEEALDLAGQLSHQAERVLRQRAKPCR